MLGLCVGDREARADGQRGELIDSVAAGTPVRKLLLIEALGHARVPFLGYRPDHRAGSSWPQSTRIVQRKRRPTSNKAEAAYNRTRMVERRREVMERWAAFAYVTVNFAT